MNEVIKRDGRRVSFDKTKIVNAIIKAMESVHHVNYNTAYKIADEIGETAESLPVEKIQDLVETKLMDSDFKDAAKSYIIYRNERSKERQRKSKIVKVVVDKLNVKNKENSNANVNEESFDGRKKEASDAVQKIIALDENISPDISEAHQDGLLYEHDLSEYNVGSHNCLFLDFHEIFTHGFKTRNGSVRVPGSISTAMQLVAVAFQCQSQVQFGGVGTVHIDYDLAPFVKKSFRKHFRKGLKYLYNIQDKIEVSDDEIYIDNKDLQYNYPEAYNYAMDLLNEEGAQAAEGLYHNLNTLESRAGGQVPFTSINIGRDTSTEGRLINKWLLNASLQGIGEFHTTSIFPISIFSYKKGVNANPGDPNYDIKKLALKSLSKRIYPNWVNGDWSNAHEDPNNPDTYMATMGCVDGDETIRIKYDNIDSTCSFETMWNMISKKYIPYIQNDGKGTNEYIIPTGLQIYDTVSGFVDVKTIIRNLSETWIQVGFSNGKFIHCTDDHPFDTNVGRVLARDLTTDMKVIFDDSPNHYITYDV